MNRNVCKSTCSDAKYLAVTIDPMYKDNTMAEKTSLRNLDDLTLTNNRFEAIKDHLYSEIKGEGVILSLKNGKYYGVNIVGSSIWQAIQSPATLQEIQTAVTREYDIDLEGCRQEVLTFLEQMVNEELVEVLNEKDS